ncbi:homocysteine S-methyltransferase 2-like [Odontomachus brunneus]|uniref:homocysteine S-methyltransferase 2-like n=1 Tax=Odontomachus brunneus TaxID=486640 RepID=UPI0013F212FD|nr:homocysteine S-methyltransferase 2-like [Odontomachus brunneus]
MSQITVVDGDFTAHLRRYLDNTISQDPVCELKALVYDRFAVYRTHLDFLRAGAKIIRTNTARVTPISVARHLEIFGSEAHSIITIAVELAQKAVFKYYEEIGGDTSNVEQFKKCRPLVAGHCASYAVSRLDSNGPVNYWRNVEEQDLVKCHRARIQILLNSGVDLLAFENIPCRMEAEVLVDLLRQFRNARVWMSFVCCNDKKLLDGSSFLEMATYCYFSLPEQVLAIGAICPSLENEISLLENVYINSFENNIPMIMYLQGKNEKKKTRKYAMHWVEEFMSLGVIYISGKSGATAEEIRLLHNAVQESLGFARPNSVATKTCSQNEENKPKL